MTSTLVPPFHFEAQRVRAIRADRVVLSDVSITVRPGEIVGVLGPNGAGKSTLLSTMAGLISPAGGFVAIDGRPLADIDRRLRARSIAFLPQQRVVHWPLTVEATVALGRFPYAGEPGEARHGSSSVAAALAEMDVAGIASRTIDTLSGGELARVLMARALAQDTALILADEPTAGLDPSHQITLFEALTAKAGQGRAVLVAIHDMMLAARFCTRLVLMRDGRLLADGTPTEVLTERLLRQAYDIEARLITVDGARIVVPLTKSWRT